MKNLLKMEFFKLKKSKSFIVCSIIAVGLTIFVVGTLAALSAMMGLVEDELNASLEAERPAIVEQYVEEGMTKEEAEAKADEEIAAMKETMMSSFAGMDGQTLLVNGAYQASIHILTAIFIALFTAAEFSNGTMKIMVASGKGRANIYLAKLVVISFASTFLMAIPMLLGCGMGTVLWGFYPETGAIAAKAIVLSLVAQFVINLGISAMFMATCVIFRSLGAAIAINIAVSQFSSILFALADAMYKYIFKAADMKLTKILPSDLWIVNAFNQSAFPANFKMDSFTRHAITGAVYFVLFTALGLFAFRKRDIK